MTLADLQKGQWTQVLNVTDAYEQDPIAHRLRELGFVAGESVSVIAKGILGGNPLVVKIGDTRFALRKKEAQRVLVEQVK
ncbi:ferrous iron transport protein A [Spongiibacter sp. KMU-158]|uniref:Ferrous iron transport protein A n=1 Tax=Spongiibacter pelagi TaxID=2760804 RepID=A0A927GWH0_9GAMM|nr:FeoA family protein [Spongiibacter pelagi]MBD2858932.1 ferrous iron transport protein A [Spongiibacter pelagi]